MSDFKGIDIFVGEIPDTGGSPSENKERCINFNKYIKSKLVVGINMLTTWINDIIMPQISEANKSISESHKFISDAKNAIEETVGANYAGAWDNEKDFTGATTTFNGALWLGISPIIGDIPDTNGNWLLLKYITKKVHNQKTSYTAERGDMIYVNTLDNDVTITLPVAVKGDRIKVIDQEFNFNKNPCVVTQQDGTIINRITDNSDYEIDIRGATRTLEVIENNEKKLEWRTV